MTSEASEKGMDGPVAFRSRDSESEGLCSTKVETPDPTRCVHAEAYATSSACTDDQFEAWPCRVEDYIERNQNTIKGEGVKPLSKGRN